MPSSIRTWGVISLFLLGVAGCGGITPAAPVSTGAQSTAGALLKGNWLIVGDLPVFFTNLATAKFGLAATLDVINGQVIANGNVFYPCGGSGAGGTAAFTPATIAADGTFTLQTLQSATSPTPTVVETIHGTVPQTAGAWSGTYSATNANPGCAPVSGTFTAVPIQPVTGTFIGSGTLGPANSNMGAAETATLTLQQGGPSSLDVASTATYVNSVNELTGSITVTGNACFKKGTLGTGSRVDGNTVAVSFVMDDGSDLTMTGNLKDTAASTIVVLSAHVFGGVCNGWLGFNQSNLLKQ